MESAITSPNRISESRSTGLRTRSHPRRADAFPAVTAGEPDSDVDAPLIYPRHAADVLSTRRGESLARLLPARSRVATDFRTNGPAAMTARANG